MLFRSGGRWSFTGMVHTDTAFYYQLVADVPIAGDKAVCLTTTAQRVNDVTAPVFYQPVTGIVVDWPLSSDLTASQGTEEVVIYFPIARFTNGLFTAQLWERSVMLTVDAAGTPGGEAF